MGTVIFDLGGVICRYRPQRRLRELARISGRAPEDVHRILYGSGFIGETERGSWTAEQIVDEVGARLGRPVGRDELEPAWLASFEVDDEVLELAGRTAARHRTALFTNNDPLLRESLLGSQPDLAAHFGDIVFSADIRAVKPTPESYGRALSIMKVEPSGALLVDDSQANVAGALRAGMPAIHFRDVRQLAAELERYV
jgi:HAD superfamily hydrolase (TIGR01509 family)